MKQSNHGRVSAAKHHLELLRTEHQKLADQDRTYVGLAFTYGMTVPEIAETSGLPEERVRALLGGA